jgi:RNA polymerase sigma-70 factor (ECF subfamily)
MKTVVEHLRRVVLGSSGVETGGQLLDRFVQQRDEGSFEALVRLHGPMVLGVCRRVLHNDHDAEDAFQATFLVLAHKASIIMPREMVGNWLYGVAYRTSLKAKSMIAKRRSRERQVATMFDAAWADGPDDLEGSPAGARRGIEPPAPSLSGAVVALRS